MVFLSIQDLCARTPQGSWRFYLHQELCSRFNDEQASVLSVIIKCIPPAWKEFLSSFSFSPDFVATHPYVSSNFNGETSFLHACVSPISPYLLSCTSLEENLSPVSDSAAMLIHVKKVSPLIFSSPLQKSHHLEFALPAVLPRLPLYVNSCIPSHRMILKYLSPSFSSLPYMAKWDALLQFQVQWPLSISQRLKPFIPHRAQDVWFRIHTFNLQVADRFSWDPLTPGCHNCKRPLPICAPPPNTLWL